MNAAKGAYVIGPLPGSRVALLCGIHAQHRATIDVAGTPVVVAALPAALRESYRVAQQQLAQNFASEIARLEAARDHALAAAAAANYHAVVSYALRAVCQVGQFRQLCVGGAALLSMESDQVALRADGGRLYLAYRGVEMALPPAGSASSDTPFHVTHAGWIDLTVAALRLVARRLGGEEPDTFILVESLNVDQQLIIRTVDDNPRRLIELVVGVPPAIGQEQSARHCRSTSRPC